MSSFPTWICASCGEENKLGPIATCQQCQAESPIEMQSKNNKKLLLSGYLRENELMSVPQDIVRAILFWIWTGDTFDIDHSDEKIIFGRLPYDEWRVCETLQTPQKNGNWEVYRTAVGTDIVQKGELHCWKFHILKGCPKPTIVVGIVDAGLVKSIHANDDESAIIGAFYRDHGDAFDNGYGLSFHSNRTIHGDDNIALFEYANMFDMKDGDSFMMILDMTQTQNAEAATLKFEIHATKRQDIDIEDEDESHRQQVAFDDVDIDKKYRLAVALYYRKRHIDQEIVDSIALLPMF